MKIVVLVLVLTACTTEVVKPYTNGEVGTEVVKVLCSKFEQCFPEEYKTSFSQESCTSELSKGIKAPDDSIKCSNETARSCINELKSLACPTSVDGLQPNSKVCNEC